MVIEMVEEYKKKLDDKIKELNSTRVFKKVTPKGDVSWYIKWVSSFIVLIGMVLTATDVYPMNLWFHAVGVLGWFVVGMLWHDRALTSLNLVAFAIFTMGLIQAYYGAY